MLNLIEGGPRNNPHGPFSEFKRPAKYAPRKAEGYFAGRFKSGVISRGALLRGGYSAGRLNWGGISRGAYSAAL